MQQPRLNLYHYWRSSCSWRVRWALNLKGLSYASVPVNLLAGEQRSATYTAKNPNQNVPTLEIDGTPFSESLAILEWLNETYPEPALLPSALLDRLKVRELSLIIVAGTQPIQNLKVQNLLGDDAALKLRFVQHFIRAGLSTYSARLVPSAQKFSFGSQVTMADLCLIPQCYNALRFQIDLAKEFPQLSSIYEHCLKTEACERAAPHNQEGAS